MGRLDLVPSRLEPRRDDTVKIQFIQKSKFIVGIFRKTIFRWNFSYMVFSRKLKNGKLQKLNLVTESTDFFRWLVYPKTVAEKLQIVFYRRNYIFEYFL